MDLKVATTYQETKSAFLISFFFQDILNGIVEKGPMFSQEEYANIIRLLHKSDPTATSHKLTSHLEKLAEIMKKVGVAV